MEELKARTMEEMTLAESKVGAMLETKKRMVEEASAKLLLLRQESRKVDMQLDEARRKKILGASSGV